MTLMKTPTPLSALVEARARDLDVRTITALSVEGFKSIHDKKSIAIAPLTVLAGANSSGKSSIMQPLLLLKQTVEASYDPGPLLLNGPNVRLTSYNQLFSKISSGGVENRFTCGFSTDGDVTLTQTYAARKETGIALLESVFAAPSEVTTLRSDMTSQEVSLALPESAIRYARSLRESVTPESDDTGVDDFRWQVGRRRTFFDLMLSTPGDGRVTFAALPELVFPLISQLETHIRRVVHVAALRGHPERTYERTTAIGPEFPGTFEHYVASVIAQWQTNKADGLDQLGADLQALGLTWKVVADVVNDVAIELRVGRLPKTTRGGSHDLVSIADVGLGVSQVLPVLVALLVAEPGQLVYIDQPELHLHPRAQSALATVLASAAKRGVRVVVETHSSLLLLGIQTLVAQGELSTDLVRFHWFSRDPKTGYSKVTSTDLDDAGAFDTDWPEDFGDVALKTESAYLDAADAVLRAKAL